MVGSTTVVAAAGAVKVDFPLASGNLQNGAPDGVALYDSRSHKVVDALSYEGAINAAMIDGGTYDLVSGTPTVAIDGSGSPNTSLSRIPDGADTGNDLTDWVATTTVTPGAANAFAANEICNDGIDNNGNGMIDCAETSCDTQGCNPFGKVCAAGACTCVGGTATELVCGDGIDDDCDGLVDCADPDCASTAACSENCTDGIDNDGDTLVDCLDPSCLGQSCGANGLTCVLTVCACPGGATTETSCTDGTDNDCDGTVDCADSDCATNPACVTTTNVWINEIHYDNAGGDVLEGAEIAGPAGTDLTGFTIVLYNGSGGVTYLPLTTLSGTIPNQQNGFGTLNFLIPGIQNGPPDGLALVSPGGVVIQFLSYEGVFAATNGPASGMTSIDIGVSEAGTEVSASLQLNGTGSTYAQFTWTGPVAASPGAINVGQTFP